MLAVFYIQEFMSSPSPCPETLPPASALESSRSERFLFAGLIISERCVTIVLGLDLDWLSMGLKPRGSDTLK
jgi:hypothetical protein